MKSVLKDQDNVFPHTGDTMLDRVLYVLRHTHHHIGELWAMAETAGKKLPDWYYRADRLFAGADVLCRLR